MSRPMRSLTASMYRRPSLLPPQPARAGGADRGHRVPAAGPGQGRTSGRPSGSRALRRRRQPAGDGRIPLLCAGGHRPPASIDDLSGLAIPGLAGNGHAEPSPPVAALATKSYPNRRGSPRTANSTPMLDRLATTVHDSRASTTNAPSRCTWATWPPQRHLGPCVRPPRRDGCSIAVPRGESGR